MTCPPAFFLLIISSIRVLVFPEAGSPVNTFKDMVRRVLK